MADQGRKAKSQRIDKLDQSLLRDINLAIESDAEEAPRSIYQRFGLAQRKIGSSQFRKYIYRRRRKMDGATPTTSDEHASLDMIEMGKKAMREFNKHLDAGAIPPYVLIDLMRASQASQLVELKQQAEERAAELHEVKMQQISKDLRKEVDERTQDGEKLTRENVYDMIDKIMRGEQ